jgi:hypothetical protein
MRHTVWMALVFVYLLSHGQMSLAQTPAPSPDLLSDVVTVSVIRLSGVTEDPRMTQLENLATEQQEGMLALRATVAGNDKIRNALANAGVTDVNSIVGAQIETGGNLTVYVR